jgi:lipoprotein-anchoring transpeptidase ErfK/SrfK
MLKRCALTILMVVICGTAADRLSAQDCGPLFWLCQRPAVPGLVPAPSAPSEVEYYGQPAQPGRRATPEQQYSQVNPVYLRQTVYYSSNEAPGTIIVDPHNHFLYWVAGGGRAVRYGIGVGRQGFQWSGVATIRDKQEWPDWYPPKEMLQRRPEIMRQMQNLRSGIGMAGGPGNPLGARALYLWQGNKDTLYRIHGTNEPWTIGRSVSSGCIRMLNQDVIDLYERTPLGAKVMVLGSRG